MSRQTLYLLIGYPGAGKTAVSKIVAEATGAVHLWADVERHKMFTDPVHSREESVKLYDELNQQTNDLLRQGESVVFDTNFNFYEDRRKLQEIANRNGAETVILWVNLPVEAAKKRAVGTRHSRNGYDTSMSGQQFDAIVSKLEPPREDEKTIKVDGAKLDRQTVLALIGQ